MTPNERENPELLNSNRISRISKGSNVPTNEIRELIKQYKVVKEFISSSAGAGAGVGNIDMQNLASGKMDRKTLQKLAKKFGRGMRF